MVYKPDHRDMAVLELPVEWARGGGRGWLCIMEITFRILVLFCHARHDEEERK